MEFLMTYGWAILAAVIAIGVLAYFGVFNPSRLDSNFVVLNSPMYSDAFNILANDLTCPTPNADCINIDVFQNSRKTIAVAGEAGIITLASKVTGTYTHNSPITD